MSDLAFSKKYDRKHSEQYFEKHNTGIRRRMTNWREHRLAAHALALLGNPGSVLDIPCGTGRFWDLLTADPDRNVLAADLNEGMLETARTHRDAALLERIDRLFQSSAFDIDLPDASVDCVFSIRLLHHIVAPEDRLRILREYHRVARQSAIVSLWVDGSVQARSRQKRDARRARDGYQNRLVIPRATIESEFAQSGFEIVAALDVLPRISMWRMYALRKRP
ncbi:MAG: class I SAM-dependent methyltransferase [Chromatiales bacterium]|nr:class I SAM-dependent methyltransferase [Chromatiales bacterium]